MGLNDEQNNIIRLFRIYKKFPQSTRNEFDLLLTPENVMNVRAVNYDEIDYQMNCLMERISKLRIKDLKRYYCEETFWNDKRYFENIMKQVKVYLMLRPALLEKHPELLI